MNKRKFFTVCSIFAASTGMLFAQVTEDALRFSSTGSNLGARALGMGNAYLGVADDYSAVLYNPAGLAQMRRLEITGGVTNYSFSNSAKFKGTTEAAGANSTSLNNFGMVFPYPTIQGSLVFAFGYNTVADFNRSISFNGFNSLSSIVPTLYDDYYEYDISFQTYLSDSSGYTPIQKNLQQSGEVRESGTIGNWSFAGAIDIEENFSFGVTMNIISGKYTYTRQYSENATPEFYAGLTPADSAYKKFEKFLYDNELTSDIKGTQFIFGILYRSEDDYRFGITMRTPAAATVKDSYTDGGRSFFSAGRSYSYSFPAHNEYGVSSPWVFSAGGSFRPFGDLLLSAEAEYVDWTQIEWIENTDLEKENLQLQKNFRSTVSASGGAEYSFPEFPLRLRGGFSYKPSPYKGDPASYAQTTVTAGAGILLKNNVLLDVASAFGSFQTYHNNYSFSGLSNSSRTDETISTVRVIFTLSYRF